MATDSNVSKPSTHSVHPQREPSPGTTAATGHNAKRQVPHGLAPHLRLPDSQCLPCIAPLPAPEQNAQKLSPDMFFLCVFLLWPRPSKLRGCLGKKHVAPFCSPRQEFPGKGALSCSPTLETPLFLRHGDIPERHSRSPRGPGCGLGLADLAVYHRVSSSIKPGDSLDERRSTLLTKWLPACARVGRPMQTAATQSWSLASLP